MDMYLGGIAVFIVGLVTIVRWASRGGKSAEAYTKERIAADLRTKAELPENAKNKAVYLSIAETLATTPLPPLPATTGVVVGSAAPATRAASAAPLKSPEPSWTRLDIGEAFKSLDNINIILYLGAFLVVVSAAIFIAYNYNALSGGFKTSFLAIFAAIFYLLGLLLYLKLPKLKPAGATFVAIGLVLVPLVGLAAYNLIYTGQDGRPIWLITSAVCLALYGLSLALLRKTYLAYFMALACVSLIESGVSQINLPTYWLAWSLSGVSIIYLALGRIKGFWSELSSSLNITAQIFLPLSLLLALTTTSSGIGPFGISLVLASIFYAVLSVIVEKPSQRTAYWVVGLVSLPVGVTIQLVDHFATGQDIAMIIGLIAAIYIVVSEVSHLSKMRGDALSAVGAVGALAAGIAVFDKPGPLTLVLAYGMGINAYLGWRKRDANYAGLAAFASLLLPFIALVQWSQPAVPSSWMAAVYFLVAMLWMVIRFKVVETPGGRQVAIVSYVVAIVTAIVFASIASSSVLTAVLLASLLLVFGLSYWEKSPNVMLAAVFLAYAVGYQVAIPNLELSVKLLFSAAIIYGISYLLTDERQKVWRYGGIGGFYLSAVAGLGSSQTDLLPVASLATGGALTMLEGNREERPVVKYLGAAALVLALEWWISKSGITETQFYSLPWAFYFAALAFIYRLKEKLETQDLFCAIALGFLTIPTIFQSLGVAGASYSLMLTAESIGLVLAGMALHYKLVWRWGVATLALELLYQLRNVFVSSPYIIFAALGLALLGLAIFLLNRRHQ